MFLTDKAPTPAIANDIILTIFLFEIYHSMHSFFCTLICTSWQYYLLIDEKYTLFFRNFAVQKKSHKSILVLYIVLEIGIVL